MKTATEIPSTTTGRWTIKRGKRINKAGLLQQDLNLQFLITNQMFLPLNDATALAASSLKMEQLTRIELVSSAWKAEVIAIIRQLQNWRRG